MSPICVMQYLLTGHGRMPLRARYVRVEITAATYGTPPMLEEITVPGGKHS